MFFEANRQLSNFSMPCLANGSFQFVNTRPNWPTCLTGTVNVTEKITFKDLADNSVLVFQIILVKKPNVRESRHMYK